MTLYLLRRVPIVMLGDSSRRSLYHPLVVPVEPKKPEVWPDHQTIVAQMLCVAPDADGIARLTIPRLWLRQKGTNRPHAVQVAHDRALRTLKETISACQLPDDGDERFPFPVPTADGLADVWSLRSLPIRTDLNLLEVALADVRRHCANGLYLQASEVWRCDVAPYIPVDLGRVSSEPFRITAARWLPAKVRSPDKGYRDDGWARGRVRAEQVCHYELLDLYRVLCDALIARTGVGAPGDRETALIDAAEVAQTIRHAGRKFSVARELLKQHGSAMVLPSFVGIEGGEIDCKVSINMMGAPEGSRTIALAVGRNDPSLARDLTQLVNDAVDAGSRLSAPPEVIVMGLASYSPATARFIDADLEAIAARTEARVIVANDAEMLLFSEHINGNGVVVIAETGSVVVARHPARDGRPARAIRLGGAEFIASDGGSAYHIVRQTMREIANAKDRITAGISDDQDLEALQALVSTLGARCHLPAFVDDLPTYIEHLATEVAKEHEWPKRHLAELARPILSLAKAHNAVAERAVRQQAHELGELLGHAIAWHVSQQSPDAMTPPRLLMVGSVAHKQFVQRNMFDKAREVLRNDGRTRWFKGLADRYELGNPELIYVSNSAGDLLAQIAWDVGRISAEDRPEDPAGAFPSMLTARRTALLELLDTPHRNAGDWQGDVARRTYSWLT